MPRLQSIGWSLIALSFLIVSSMFIWFIAAYSIQIYQINPFFILEIFFWPINHNITGNFVGNIIITGAWNCFGAGLGFLILHYVAQEK